MELTLFCVFVGISCLLIFLGFYRPEHTELVLIGFFFLFLLSFTLMNGNLEYKSGEFSREQYTYMLIQPDNVSVIARIDVTTNYNYSSFNDSSENFNSHRSGYWLAVVAVIGFIVSLVSIRRTKRFDT